MPFEHQQQRLATLQTRLERARRQFSVIQQIEGRYPWYRLAVLIVGLLAVYLAFQFLPALAAWAVTLVAFGGFIWVTVLHRDVIERMNRLEAFQKLLESQIARLKLDWPGIPAPTVLQVPAEHPFAADLNVTGSRSLHQLLDTSISQGGSQCLAGWLLASEPQPESISARQALVHDLLDRPAFRLQLELNGRLAHPQAGETRWDSSTLTHWLEKRLPNGSLRPLLLILSILAAANLVLFALNALSQLPPFWIGTFLLYFALQAFKYRESSEVFEEAYTLSRQLGELRRVLSGLEDYPYPRDSRLAALCAPFWQAEKRPSTELRRIGWIATAASLRGNPFLNLLLNILVPWDMFFAYQLERYKIELNDLLPVWLKTWYELESLTALANFAALNPENTFPVLAPLDTEPVFAGKGIGHPLIPAATRIANDFSIDRLGQIGIITGSNMSGKSTFLRTVGINLVLAQAGSTVCAKALRIQPFRLYTSMNLVDSLSDGISFFYAEVRRLKALLDQLESANPYPLFFLIDEIFRGTNNRERQVGSRAYSEALADKHGVGLISTHDLELAHLAETIPAVSNFHFREDVQGDRMVFDYHLRPGPSPTTNALRIMALAGLPVQAK